jgi:deoxyribodipyrimidine photo-lyase
MILFIHRKDLRVDDMSAFDYMHGLASPSIHVLILDPLLLGNNRHQEHSGINFLRHVTRLQNLYESAGHQLYIAFGEPSSVIQRIIQKISIDEIVLQKDFTPYSIARDSTIGNIADQHGIKLTSFIDHTIAHFTDFQRFSGRTEPYKVFTPFYRKWSSYVHDFYSPSSPVTLHNLQTNTMDRSVLEAFTVPFNLQQYPPAGDPEAALLEFIEYRLAAYAQGRDRYGEYRTSLVSKPLSAGAISIRRIYEALLPYELAGAWLRQLAWRDFYIYQSIYDIDFFRYETRYDLSSLSDRHFENWCKGRTGIPIIDAAMTELNQTGQMPNRLRMVTAMFLTKNLLAPFTLGEQYFRNKLSDYDHTLNRGGWLWCSSLGFDAAPYFRIMNPVTQSKTHDPEGRYIRKWLPSLLQAGHKEIHLPQNDAIVDLKTSRARAIEVYKHILR